MVFSRPMQYAISAAALSVLFAGSAAWGSQVTRPVLGQAPGIHSLAPNFALERKGPGFMQPHAKGAQLFYVADEVFNFVQVYAQANFKLIGSLGSSNGVDSPYGLYVSPTNDLYVTSYYGYVMGYHEASLHPFMTWYDGGANSTWNVATCGSTVYATELGANTIVKFVPGNPNPVGTLHETNMAYVYGIATDSKCDIFVDGITSSSEVEVDYFPHGNSNPTKLQTLGTFGSGAAPGGLAIDSKGNLIVDNEGYSGFLCGFCDSVLLRYAPPWNGSATSSVTFYDQFHQFALSQDESTIWTADINPYGYEGYYYCDMDADKDSPTGGSPTATVFFYDYCGMTLDGAATSPHNRIGP